jgi:hypothetical protein
MSLLEIVSAAEVSYEATKKASKTIEVPFFGDKFCSFTN